jgi:putative colanic acid biosynthesis UDP-glucose lipid carrier transferase
VFGYVSGYLQYFDRDVLVTWWWVAPVSQFVCTGPAAAVDSADLAASGSAQARHHRGVKRVVRGTDPAPAPRSLRAVRVVGFFDDRGDKRLQLQGESSVLGKIQDLPRFASENDIDQIYISLPMASQPRILALLDGLRDTTSSIYFVPDIFITELIQGRMDAVLGLPIVAVCETPFTGAGRSNQAHKRYRSLSADPCAGVTAAAGHCARRQADVTGAGDFQAAALRSRWQGDHRLQVPYDDRGEDGAVVRQASRSDTRVTRSAHSCAGPRWMSSRNSSTCSRVT